VVWTQTAPARLRDSGRAWATGIYLHMSEEFARHNGHANLIRGRISRYARGGA
jgi:hypothetical protein